MSIPFWCVFIAALLIYLAKLPVVRAMNAEAGGYDNHHPRLQQTRLSGLGARAMLRISTVSRSSRCSLPEC